jgi:hypothetical protein
MDFEKILTEAHEAATAAILAKFQKGDWEHPFNCGFAWVTLPKRHPLAAHARKKLGDERKASREMNMRYGSEGHPPSRWQWWEPGQWPTPEVVGGPVYGQDMDFHAVGAIAFSEVLLKYGIEAQVGTRLD